VKADEVLALLCVLGVVVLVGMVRLCFAVRDWNLRCGDRENRAALLLCAARLEASARAKHACIPAPLSSASKKMGLFRSGTRAIVSTAHGGRSVGSPRGQAVDGVSVHGLSIRTVHTVAERPSTVPADPMRSDVLTLPPAGVST